MSDLQPITPADAVELYMAHREPEVSKKTLHNHQYRLNSFLDWCEERNITNMNSLTGRDVHLFRVWRLGQGINKVTLRSQLATLRVFFGFCATIEAVEPGLRERVLLPDLDDEESARDERLETDRAEEILDYLAKFEYASRDHVIMAILWHTGIRLGSLRAFDVRDYDRDDECLWLRHRPETGTPLKNGKKAERAIAIGSRFIDVIEDYLEYHRVEITDAAGREPLISSNWGRLSSTAIRNTVYRRTRPCMLTECPHDRNPETCEAMESDHASECPSTRSPHGIRRGSITQHLRSGTPEEIVSDRMNVSSDILDKHYDRRSEREKMQLRKQFITEL